jgi:hypothetical protein
VRDDDDEFAGDMCSEGFECATFSLSRELSRRSCGHENYIEDQYFFQVDNDEYKQFPIVTFKTHKQQNARCPRNS